MFYISPIDILKAKIKDYPQEIKLQIHSSYWDGYHEAWQRQKIDYRWLMGLEFVIINLLWLYFR